MDRFDYLKQYSLIRCGFVNVFTDVDKGKYERFDVKTFVNGKLKDEGAEIKLFCDIEEEAKHRTDNKLREIISENKNIFIRQMPSVEECEGKYICVVRLAYCN